MAIGMTLFIISALIIAIWIIIEVKRMKHKIFAILLICIILVLYLSSTFVFRGHDIKWNTLSGITEGTTLYFSWLGSAFTNVKTITSYAVQQDWKSVNESKKETSELFSLTQEK